MNRTLLILFFGLIATFALAEEVDK
ncbi:MAG: hypothetical protein CG441_1263, partial [Methylococcaceae bacterium NSM2-1]